MLKSSIFLLIICLGFISIIEKMVLRSPATVVELFILAFSSSSSVSFICQSVIMYIYCLYCFPGGSVVNSTCQCRRHGLDPWVGKKEKEMATHSTILAWEIPWTEKPGGLQSIESQRVRHDSHTHTHTYTLYILLYLPDRPMLCHCKIFLFLSKNLIKVYFA